jgi:hypothetical protein
MKVMCLGFIALMLPCCGREYAEKCSQNVAYKATTKDESFTTIVYESVLTPECREALESPEKKEMTATPLSDAAVSLRVESSLVRVEYRFPTSLEAVQSFVVIDIL